MTAESLAPPAGDRAAGSEPPSPRQVSPPTLRRRWPWLPRYAWAGTAYALVLACLSFTPSLLPRSWLLQGIIAGISAAIGYTAGEVLAWLVRQFSDRRPSPRDYVNGWAAVAQPPGWTPADTERLRAVISTTSSD